MKKILIAALLCTFTLTAAFAGTGRDKKDNKEVNLNLHIAQNGDININGKTYTDKDIEKWINDHLKNISINIEDNSDDKPVTKKKEKTAKKTKTLSLSVTIDEK